MANKRKTTTAIVAGVTAVALLLGGTFAWTSISQQAKNESAGIVNVGGRLHDDFNGTNKDVYVENFTDTLNGGQPIYARVRLDEYMEVGKEAGQADNADRNAVPVVENTDINDVETWIPHIPETDCAVCATEGTCAIHDHWEWEMGGQTTFMPTFNKDKDSLAADINGTYQGTDDTDKIYYDDYVVYTTDSANGGNNIAEADKETYDGEIYSVVGTEYYDDDTDTEDNGGTRQVADVTHTAKLTADGTVMTMTEWLANPVPGNFWVYDTDGWAYWANPIMPGEATGLLLSNINMKQNPGEKCYYAINVVGQFATVNDWEYFDGWDENSDAAKVMAAAVSNVPTVTVTSDANVVFPGQTLQFSATVSQGAVSSVNDSVIEWSLYNADGTAYNGNSAIDTNGLLNVAAEEAEGTILTVVARSTEYLGAVGMKSVMVQNPDIDLTIDAESGLKNYIAGTEYSEKFTASVTGDNVVGGSISWSLTDGDGATLAESELSADGNTATLKIGVSETAKQILVCATYTSDEGHAVTESYTIGLTFTTTDNLDATAYVLLTDDGRGNGTYDATMIRSYETGLTGKCYNGSEVLVCFDAIEEDYGDGLYGNYNYYDWTSTYKDKITSITVANTIQPKSLWCYFRGKSAVESMDLSKLDTSLASDMFCTFMECSSLKEITLPDGFGSSATTMRALFDSDSKLETVTFEGSFGGESLTNISDMFAGCIALKTIDLSDMILSTEAIDVSGMFEECSSLVTAKMPKNIVISGSIRDLFDACYELTVISNLETWDVSRVNNFSLSFYDCKKLESVDLSSWVTTQATDMYMMFEGCSSLQYLDLSGFDLNGVKDCYNMFLNCTELTEIKGAENWDVSTVTNMYRMFEGCKKLTLDCSSWSATTDSGFNPGDFNEDAPGVTM